VCGYSFMSQKYNYLRYEIKSSQVVKRVSYSSKYSSRVSPINFSVRKNRHHMCYLSFRDEHQGCWNKIIENYSKYLSTYLNTENKFSILHALGWFSMFESVTFYLMAALCDSFKNCYNKCKIRYCSTHCTIHIY